MRCSQNTISFLHLDHRLSSQGSDLPKPFAKSILAHTATVLSCNMALIITSTKPINPSYFTIVSAHPGSALCYFYYRNVLCRLSYFTNSFVFHRIFSLYHHHHHHPLISSYIVFEQLKQKYECVLGSECG